MNRYESAPNPWAHRSKGAISRQPGIIFILQKCRAALAEIGLPSLPSLLRPLQAHSAGLEQLLMVK